MGMYTELYLAVELDKDLPKDLVKFFMELSNDDFGVEENLPTCFQGKTRIAYMGHMDSYYFDSIPMIDFKYDTISKSYFLTTIFNLKNYEDEIDIILNVLTPYILTKGHIGHMRYEESISPTTLYHIEGKTHKIYPNYDVFKEIGFNDDKGRYEELEI